MIFGYCLTKYYGTNQVVLYKCSEFKQIKFCFSDFEIFKINLFLCKNSTTPPLVAPPYPLESTLPRNIQHKCQLFCKNSSFWEDFFKNPSQFQYIELVSSWKRVWQFVKQTLIPFEYRCFKPFFFLIGPLVLALEKTTRNVKSL